MFQYRLKTELWCWWWSQESITCLIKCFNITQHPFSSLGLWEAQSAPETPSCRPAREELSTGSHCNNSGRPHPWTPPHTHPHRAQASTHHPFTQQVSTRSSFCILTLSLSVLWMFALALIRCDHLPCTLNGRKMWHCGEDRISMKLRGFGSPLRGRI